MVGISWRIANHQDVVVRDYGGGPNDPLQRIREIETEVWTNEPIRFDQLVIENHTGTKSRFTVGYQDLQGSLGPHLPSVDALTPGTMLALSTLYPSPAGSSHTAPTSWLVIPGMVVGPLAFVILLVPLIVMRGRRRFPGGSGRPVAS